MEFTNNIVLSLLMPYRGKPYIRTDVKKIYQWVSLLPEYNESLNDDMLYVCSFSDAITRNRNDCECHFVCICDRYISEDDRENAELMRNIILVEENRSLSWLLNLIQQRFIELERWETELRDILISEGSYQEIIDSSEKYLKNALFVLDSSYHLIAYSKNYMSPDRTNVALYEKGYYSDKEMQLFYRYSAEKNYFNTTEIAEATPGQMNQFESLSKWCWYEGNQLLKIVIVFYNTPQVAESKELFNLMVNYINLCLHHEQKHAKNPIATQIRFLKDMLMDTLSDSSLISQYSEQAKIPYTGYFDAYRIIFDDTNKVLLGRFVHDLADKLPSSKIVCIGHEISILNIYKSANIEEKSALNFEKIAPMLKSHNGQMGVSSPFYKLNDFPTACAHASNALQYSSRKYSYTPSADTGYPCIRKYTSTQLYYMLSLCASDARNYFDNNVYYDKVLALIKADSNLAYILFCYLYYERRASSVGDKLHIHRNTVTYHIQRATEMLNLDLDDYMTRMQLLLAFHYAEMEGKALT